MRINETIATIGVGGYYFDDQKAIQMGAIQDGLIYRGKPITSGFGAIRQKGESISIMLRLEDGQVAIGDCTAVQYSGVGGRDPIFLAEDYISLICQEVFPRLRGLKLSSFRELATEFDEMIQSNGQRLHTAIRYGITQALLDAVAKSRHRTMAEIIAEEYGTVITERPIPIFAQTGDERHLNADKCIIKRADVLPHGLINCQSKLGEQGELLLEYVEWLKNRVFDLGKGHYRPSVHLDVYGTIGQLFNDDLEAVAAYIGKLEEKASPLQLKIEGPIDLGSKEGQIAGLKQLREKLTAKRVSVQIVADEWCNTLDDIKEFTDARAGDVVQIKTPDLGGINNSIEAVLYAKKYGMGAYLGGTCNETEYTAKVCVHIALATQPDQILAKPGLGVDEGFMITYNEMQRAMALFRKSAS
jgi:methylaspartate ammonia-lyase